MLVSNKIIDYSKQWGVNISIIPTKEFNSYQIKEGFYKNPHNNTGVIEDSIIVDECLSDSQNPTDDRILHELAHIVINVPPNSIKEFRSPYFALWFKMMQETNSKHRLMFDHEVQNMIHGMLGSGNNIYEAVDSFVPELIMNGLLNNHNELTFDYTKVKPSSNWVK